MHQSGTHWLKYMLANALAHRYGLPPPQFNHANDFIGGPRDAVVHAVLPRLLSGHTIAHPLLRIASVHTVFGLPHHVVLLRDIRDSLISNYMKWREHYAVSFSVYLEGDPAGRRYNSDLWWSLRFLNAWGEVVQRVPTRVTVIRYEDLRDDTLGELNRVASALKLELSPAALQHGVACGSKVQMEARHDPARPPGAVRRDTVVATATFNATDRAFFARVVARYLRHTFGYDYSSW